jgi:glycosyltransferase involved in cell wall biosynthesis
MKILVLNYEYPPLGGGAGVITQHISEGLARLGHKITVITTWFENLPEKEEQDNLKIIRLKSKRKFTYRSNVLEMLSWVKFSKRFLVNFLIENSFDLCFANFAIPGGIVALYLKNKYNIPYAIISHGHDIPWFCKKEMFWYHLVLFPIIKNICKKSELNFVQTGEMKTNIDRFLGKKQASKNIIIANGCDTQQFFPETTRQSSLFKIIFSGRLVKQKDPFTFLNAVKLLSKKNIQYTATVFGDGPLRKSMEKFVKGNQLMEVVRFAGWVSKQKLAEEYRSADVFVQTSIHEAMSIAIMEALSSGTYVFCTSVGINSDLIYDGVSGEIIPVTNPIILAEKLTAFYYEKFLKGYIVDSNTTKKFLIKYDWATIVQQYELAFKNLSTSKQTH